MSYEAIPRARLALADAEEAADRLRERLANGGNYRIDWTAAVTLLRVVGHVLHKVDGEADPDVGDAVNRAWRQWNDAGRGEHSVFREFIEKERNNVLKQYEIGRFAPVGLLTEDGYPFELEQGGRLLAEQPDLDRISAALDWWEQQLAAIESRVDAARRTRGMP